MTVHNIHCVGEPNVQYLDKTTFRFESNNIYSASKHVSEDVQNTTLRKTFGSKTDGVKTEWRTLHNEDLYDLYCSPNIIRVMQKRKEMGRHVGGPEGMRPLGRLRRRRDDNIKMDFKKWDREACGKT